MAKVLDFINEYSAVIALGIMVVGLIVLIIFKVLELKKLEKIWRKGDRIEDYTRDVRIFIRNVDVWKYDTLEAIKNLNDTVNFQSNLLRDIVSTDFATRGNATLKELHAIHKLLKKEVKKG